MKRTIFLVAGLVAVAAIAYGVSSSGAQGGGGQPVTAKIGVVNIGTVFVKYQKAVTFKDQLQTMVKPYKDKADAWRGEMIKYQDLITKGDFKQYKKEDLEKAILDRKRALEDMDREVRNLIGKQQEDQLVQLWKEVTEHIRSYGRTGGFQMVFGYGDPMKAEELDLFPNINRKMQGMDLGAVCPLYVSPGHDVTEDVILSLNTAFKNRPAGASGLPNGGGITPTAGSK